MSDEPIRLFDWTTDNPVVCHINGLPYTEAMLERLYARLDNPPSIPDYPPILLDGSELPEDEWLATIERWKTVDNALHDVVK